MHPGPGPPGMVHASGNPHLPDTSYQTGTAPPAARTVGPVDQEDTRPGTARTRHLLDQTVMTPGEPVHLVRSSFFIGPFSVPLIWLNLRPRFLRTIFLLRIFGRSHADLSELHPLGD
jgi:hypothetical protein